MNIVNFANNGYGQIGASGICPHCMTKSYLRPIQVAYVEHVTGGPSQKAANPVQCESCKGFALVVGYRSQQNNPWVLDSVFPLGKPNDQVDTTVPKNIAEDFSEALRCEWVKAYKGCVTMCRRAVQNSALELGAKPKAKLVDQIDELFTKGRITEPLKEFAHEVRLTGNDGAHPDKDGLENVTPKDAADMIEFTREYLHHVYVMPAKLKARKGGQATPVAALGTS